MAQTTFGSIIRSGPRGSAYAGTTLLSAQFSFDPTAASAATGVILPLGSVIVDIVTDGGATGGTAPTVDIGTSGTADAYAAEQAADSVKSAVAAGTLGTAALTALTADTEIYAGVGASAATGGTVVARVLYYRNDDKSGVNK